MDQNLTIQLTLCTSHIQGDQATFEILAQTFHYSQIMGLDVCARKPLIATCSMDKSVRIWNFETWYVGLKGNTCSCVSVFFPTNHVKKGLISFLMAIS